MIPDVGVVPELRQILGSWLAFLSGVVSEGVLYVAAAKHKKSLDIHLRLFENSGSPEMACRSVPGAEDALNSIVSLGGEFRIQSTYPETAVMLKVPLALTSN